LLDRLTAALVAFGPLGVFLLGFIDSAGVPVAMGMDALIVLVGIVSFRLACANQKQ
jgi:hypothetical protein